MATGSTLSQDLRGKRTIKVQHRYSTCMTHHAPACMACTHAASRLAARPSLLLLLLLLLLMLLRLLLLLLLLLLLPAAPCQVGACHSCGSLLASPSWRCCACRSRP